MRPRKNPKPGSRGKGPSTTSASSSSKPGLPGFDIKFEDVPLDEQHTFPTALLDHAGRLLTVREYTMMEIMNRITDKIEWNMKIFDAEISQKWQNEAMGTKEKDVSKKMMDYCIAELKYKARLFKDTDIVEAFGAAFKSDTIVSDDLRRSLIEAVAPLEDVPPRDQDWHPGSKNQVLDLVHPSLYPLVFGQSRILTGTSVGLDDCLRKCGAGMTIPIPDILPALPNHSWSTRFQWLPTDFETPPGGNEVKTLSYINNLHPRTHLQLYSIIEQIVAKAIPLWNQTLAQVTNEHKKRPRLEVSGNGYREQYPSPERRKGDTDEALYRRYDRYDQKLKARTVLQPEPAGFRPTPGRLGRVDLRKDFGKLQIIVKLANIHLTPEKPSYSGGSWHVESQLNENICATALYYYDSENISESLLALRQCVDGTEIEYEQDDYRALEKIYGFRNENPCIQKLGDIATKEGRLLTFPNVYQHRVRPFELVDSTKPGHRKILALFLVNPRHPIISTANIPCQQKAWWAHEIRDIGPLGAVPTEVADRILECPMDFPVSLEVANKQRLELMEERKNFIQTYKEDLKHFHTFNLCEH